MKNEKPMTKERKFNLYGNARVRRIPVEPSKNSIALLALPDMHRSRKKAKEQAKLWREIDRYARVYKVKGGYQVYVSRGWIGKLKHWAGRRTRKVKVK